jgi:hypothetical protein
MKMLMLKSVNGSWDTSIDDSTGKGLSDVTLKLLEKNKLELKHCRGQENNNGVNMKGTNSGVQKRILDQNPLTFFMPCGCHNLNRVIWSGKIIGQICHFTWYLRETVFSICCLS